MDNVLSYIKLYKPKAFNFLPGLKEKLEEEGHIVVVVTPDNKEKVSNYPSESVTIMLLHENISKDYFQNKLLSKIC